MVVNNKIIRIMMIIYKRDTIGAGEIAQLSRAHIVLPEDLSLVLSNHVGQLTTICNSSSRRSNALFWPP